MAAAHRPGAPAMAPPVLTAKPGGPPGRAAPGRAAPPVLYPTGATKAKAAEPAKVRPSSKPSRGQPDVAMIELDAAEVVSVPTSASVQTPPSGLPASDEWLGHVLLGYAPFNVAIGPRTMSGEIALLDPAKATPSAKR
jgi:hypothetical protein